MHSTTYFTLCNQNLSDNQSIRISPVGCNKGEIDPRQCMVYLSCSAILTSNLLESNFLIVFVLFVFLGLYNYNVKKEVHQMHFEIP
jgi:hypothetical protein